MSDMAMCCMSEGLCTLCEDITSSLETTLDGIYYYLAEGKRTSSYESRPRGGEHTMTITQRKDKRQEQAWQNDVTLGMFTCVFSGNLCVYDYDCPASPDRSRMPMK